MKKIFCYVVPLLIFALLQTLVSCQEDGSHEEVVFPDKSTEEVIDETFVKASFENRNGYDYAVLTNFGSSSVYVEWMCVNEALGQSRHGEINLMAGYEACIGPNFNWYWQPGEQFFFTTNVGSSDNISFKGRELWWGEGTPPDSDRDGYKKTSATVLLQDHKYHIYVKSSAKYIYDKKKGWCSKW